MNRRSASECFFFNVSRLCSFLLVLSLVVTITMFVFLHGMELDEDLIRRNGLNAFLCLIVLTLAGCGIDALRRHIMVDRPIQRILDALNQIAAGDLSVRLDSNHRDFYRSGLREISIGINALTKELSGVEALRSDFIANVSHELKTPLAAVGNYARLLQDPALPEEKRQEYTLAISDTTRRLADLVSNILKLNKLENQQIYPETRIFDLGEQLCESLLEFESIWESKHLDLECEIAEAIHVAADPELLKLVWSNLFSNAIKFTPDGGRITLRLTSDGSWACVSVSDTGCGMTPETGAHIFEKFYQGDTAHATQGNGLGLALVKQVVDITGGVISVTSTPGKGSTFTVRLGMHNHNSV